MITRRTVLMGLASAPGGAAAAPLLASFGALAEVGPLNATWLVEEATGRFWQVGDLRPFFRAYGLARSEARVQLINRKQEATTWRSGADFLYGEPLAAVPNVDELLARWQRRHEPKPPDWSLATTQEWWWRREPDGERQHGIPWAVLEAAWRDTPPFECPNCDTPTILSGFGWKRVSFFGFDPWREFVCPTCRRRHVGPPAVHESRMFSAFCTKLDVCQVGPYGWSIRPTGHPG